MAKKTCSKGHIYDSAIYGDSCPFCPSMSTSSIDHSPIGSSGGNTIDNLGGTEVNTEGKTQVNSGTGETSGPTVAMGGQPGYGGGTVIRPAGGGPKTPSEKRIIGLLVTYDTKSTGQVFNIYEGRNYVGRDATSDIHIQGDVQISGKHFSVLYRVVDEKFKFRDEQSSNGTFVNEVLTDEGELNTFDVIRIGSTRFVFVAIPQLK